MATHTADIGWALKNGEDFAKGRYSRGHTVRFDGGAEISASASPHVVGKWAVEAAVDPEEMLVAAVSSCHMLSFLHAARLAGFIAAAYGDHAEGVLEEIAPGRYGLTKIMLEPRIEWAGAVPDDAALDHLHHEAHLTCYIANSVKRLFDKSTLAAVKRRFSALRCSRTVVRSAPVLKNHRLTTHQSDFSNSL